MDLKNAPIHYTKRGQRRSTSVTSLTLHIPSSRLIYVTPMSPYRPCCRYKSCLYTNSTYTTSHSLVHLKHNLTQPRTILGIQQHSSLYQFATIIFLNNKRGAPRGGGGRRCTRRWARRCAGRCARRCSTSCIGRCVNVVTGVQIIAKNCDNEATKLLNLSRSCLKIVTKMSHSLSQALAVILQCPKANVVAPSRNNTRLSSSPLNATLLCNTEYVCSLCALNE